MTTPIPPSTDELRAAFNRCRGLHLAGWTFQRACDAPLVRWSLTKLALATREKHHLPAQPRLI